MALSVLVARIARKDQRKEADHIVGGQTGHRDTDQPEEHVSLRQHGPQDLVFAKETSEGRSACDSQDADQKGPVGEGLLFPKASHLANVLFAVQVMSHHARPKKEERLKEGVREKVKEGLGIRAYAGA